MTFGREVQKGNFRQDLFYRLHVIQLRLPPLRKRPTDIPMLADIFLKRFALKYSKAVSGFSQRSERQLVRHNWPGNIRELEHAVERAVILSRSGLIDSLDLNFGMEEEPPLLPEPYEDPGEAVLAPFSRPKRNWASLWPNTWPNANGSIWSTCWKAAGAHRRHRQGGWHKPQNLYLKMGKYGLSRSDFRPFKGAAAKAARMANRVLGAFGKNLRRAAENIRQTMARKGREVYAIA